MSRLVRAVTLMALLVVMWSGPAHPVAAPVGASGSSTPGALYGVAALSSRDVWAVGVPAGCVASPIHCALIEHWDGARWRVVPAPETTPHLGWLNAVAALSSRDVWAVGGFPHQTDALRWDGTRWRVVPTPALDGQLLAVAAVSPRDVWAVGPMAATAAGAGPAALSAHWDGTRWRVVPVAGTGLVGVAALSSRDVWAVGEGDQGGLIAHWDGARWRAVYESDSKVPCCLGIAATARDDVWVVGGDIFNPTQPVALHWDGQHWRNVPLPVVKNSALMALAAVSSQDVWAVGFSQSGTLTEHWDGVRWRVVPSPNAAGRENALLGVAAVSARDVWAVGVSGGPAVRGAPTGKTQTLIEHWDGVRWSIVPS